MTARDGGARCGTSARAAGGLACVLAAAAAGCAIPPWSMGHPLDGKPSVPPTTAAPSLAALHAAARAERAAGHPALELRALTSLAAAQRLTGEERGRLIALLEQRATELLALGRAVPATADLRLLDDLDPARARALADVRAQAERAAGDAWLAVGDAPRAREAYRRAAALGAPDLDFRRAAAGDDEGAVRGGGGRVGVRPEVPGGEGATPLARLPRPALERALLELPLRALPAFAEAYLALPPADRSPAALARARRAAEQEGRRALLARIDAALGPPRAPENAPPPTPFGGFGTDRRPATPAAAGALVVSAANLSRAAAPDAHAAAADVRASAVSPVPAGDAARAPSGGFGTDRRPVTPAADGALTRDPLDDILDAPAVPAASRAPTDEARLSDWVVGAASVSFRLLPLLGQRRDLLAPSERSRAWSNLLLDEDPTAPEVLALTALIDGLAGRVGGAERKLTDLIYFTPDRYLGMVRAAGIWERVGQPRLACATWLRAARWRDEPEDPIWRRAIACTRRDPAAGDWRAITDYVLRRAPAERRAALAAALEPSAARKPALLESTAAAPPAPASGRRAGEPIPCDNAGSPR